MKTRYKMQVKWISILLCILALTLFLVACTNGQGTGNAAPAPKPTPTPTPTSTPTGTTYAGTGFTLSYPKDWKESTQNGTGEDVFVFQPPNAGPDGNTGFVVAVSAQAQTGNSDAAISAALAGLKGQVSNFQQITSLPSTITVGGDSWKQAGITGTEQGQQIKSLLLAVFHTASSRLYIITIGDTAAAYNQDNTNIFQLMLQSFKFA